MTRLMSKQKVRLFELLEENYHILSGNPNRGNGEKTAVWEEIKDNLNELGPPKTTEKWRRVWTDIRKTLRKKVSLRHTYEINGARVPDEFIFSESDLWVIRICGMDAIQNPSKTIKQEVTDFDTSATSSLRLADEKPTRSSARVSNRKSPRKQQPEVDELNDDQSLLCPVVVFSDDKATQCSESNPSDLGSPPQKKLKISSSSSDVFESCKTENLASASEVNNNRDQLKQLIYLQKRQLAVTRQIHERQKCHNADQRQFNARVTNLLEEILQQLKTNKKTN
ncbi:uncharacterized protein LOC129950914 [Eupeodes corollae]|uniref:uncharacterized protein LOC129950914 n=1 Tax=Eupeodes corollae TaxID=290404 RepID=UPI002493A703|nr:uncharacterized protein LOC129950914 [Eupeodes corollae]